MRESLAGLADAIELGRFTRSADWANLGFEFICSAPGLVPRRPYPRTDRNREKSVFSEEPTGQAHRGRVHSIQSFTPPIIHCLRSVPAFLCGGKSKMRILQLLAKVKELPAPQP